MPGITPRGQTTPWRNSPDIQEKIRAFIAIKIPRPTQLHLHKEVRKILDPNYSHVKIIPFSKIHLTLAFLGNVRRKNIGHIEEVLTTVGRITQAFKLELRGTGIFPKHRPQRILWIGIRGDLNSLSSLQRSVERNLILNKLVPFGRFVKPFTPHLTIARTRGDKCMNKLMVSKWLESQLSISQSRFGVHEITLFQSTFQRNGTTYTPIASVKLMSGSQF